MPLYECRDSGLPPKEISEQQFIQSFTDFTAQQGLPYKASMDKPYPYNILLSFEQAVKAMKWHKPDSELAIVYADDNKLALAEREQYCTNSTLFYIPVNPLYKILKAKPRSRGLQIILSVFSYLYLKVNIPYFRDEGTFLYWQYEMIKDWVESDPDSYEGDTYHQRLDEISRAAVVGDEIGKELYKPCHLSQFEQRINKFVPKTDWDMEAHLIGKRALQLYRDFPNATLYDNVNNHEFDHDYISIGDYVSFIHDLDGSLCDELFNTVNEDFGNRGQQQEPATIHMYGTAETERKTIGFEQQLFPLIDDLVTLLMRL